MLKSFALSMPTLAALGPFLGTNLANPSNIGQPSSLYLFRILVPFFALVLIAYLVRAGTGVPPVARWLLLPLVLLLVSGGLGMAVTPRFVEGLTEYVTILASLTLAILIASVSAHNSEFSRKLLWGWLLAFAVVWALTAFETVVGFHFQGSFYSEYERYLGSGQAFEYASATLGNPNDLAGFGLVAFPLAMGLAILLRKAWLQLLILGGLITIEVWAASRSGLVGALLLSLAWAMLRLTARISSVLTTVAILGYGIAVAVLSVITAGTGRIPFLDQVVSAFAADSAASDQLRVQASEIAWNEASNTFPLVGAGPASFEYFAVNTYFLVNPNLHNGLLEVAYQYGALSALAVVISAVAILGYGARGIVLATNARDHLISWVGIGTFVSLAVWSVSSSSLLESPVWSLALGTAVGLIALARPGHVDGQPPASAETMDVTDGKSRTAS